jgi:hypothetical protein
LRRERNKALNFPQGIAVFEGYVENCGFFCSGGFRNLVEKNRPDLEDNPEMLRFTQSVDKVKNNMVVLTFYFE